MEFFNRIGDEETIPSAVLNGRNAAHSRPSVGCAARGPGNGRFGETLTFFFCAGDDRG